MPESDFGLGQEILLCPVRVERPSSGSGVQSDRPQFDRQASGSCSNTPPRTVSHVYAGQPPYSPDRVPTICGSPVRDSSRSAPGGA